MPLMLLFKKITKISKDRNTKITKPKCQNKKRNLKVGEIGLVQESANQKLITLLRSKRNSLKSSK